MSFIWIYFKCQTILFDQSDVTTAGQSGSGGDSNEGVLTIRLFSVVFRTFVQGDAISVFYSPSRLGKDDPVLPSAHIEFNK